MRHLTRAEIAEMAVALCRVGEGYKRHLTKDGRVTLCGYGYLKDALPMWAPLVSGWEDWKGLCQNCMRVYRKG